MSAKKHSPQHRSAPRQATDVELVYKQIRSPVGRLKLVASSNALIALTWGREDLNQIGLSARRAAGHQPVLAAAELQLSEYFAGKRTHFELELAPRGTEFQEKVWRCLRAIPYGQTSSYGDIARAIGSPHACRAVGGAIGRNPLSIVIPCHRVIGASGALTGFGGGIETKAKLLALETRASVRKAP